MATMTTKTGIWGTLAIVVILTLAANVSQSQQVFKVDGIVDTPRMFVAAITPETHMSFGGWVNFPPDPSKGRLEIDVLRVGNDKGTSAQRDKAGLSADNTPTSCSASGEDQKIWKRKVIPVTIDSTATVVNGVSHYRWHTASFTPFLPDAVASVPENRIPEGGIARVRFRAIVNAQETLLHGLDSDGVRTTGCELLFGDSSPSPVAPPNVHLLSSFSTAKNLPTPNYLDRGDTGTAADTDSYYDRVYLSSDGSYAFSVSGRNLIYSLVDPSHQIEGITTLRDFKNRYGFGPNSSYKSGQTELIENISYFNQGDLGIGRRMSCERNSSTDETACFVENFGNTDKTAAFDNFGASTEAMRQGHAFATVAMVERGKMAPGSRNKTFFVVYDKDGKLVTTAPLDTKGFNAFIPGNCTTCHGGDVVRDASGKVNGVTGASFLPFNPSAFQFFDDKLGPDNNSRGALQASIKRLNEIVYNTDLFYNDFARTLINGWYGHEVSSWGFQYIAPKFLFPGLSYFLGSTFDDKFVPPGWDDTKEDQQLYKQVVAPYCLTCHVASKTFTFDTAAKFKTGTTRELVYQDVCTSHSMPNAEMTSKLLWKSNARLTLLDRLSILNGCGWEGPDVNDILKVEALPGRIEQPAVGCPTDFASKSTFDLRIENPYFSKSKPSEKSKIVSNLFLEVSSLTNGNLMLFPDGTTGAAGSVFAPALTIYAPGTVDMVPISICQKPGPSSFSVNMLGTEK